MLGPGTFRGRGWSGCSLFMLVLLALVLCLCLCVAGTGGVVCREGRFEWGGRLGHVGCKCDARAPCLSPGTIQTKGA